MTPVTLDDVRLIARRARHKKTDTVPSRVRFDHAYATQEIPLRDRWYYERMPNTLTLVGHARGALDVLYVPQRVALARLHSARDLPARYRTGRTPSLERFTACDPHDFGTFTPLMPEQATNIQFRLVGD